MDDTQLQEELLEVAEMIISLKQEREHIDLRIEDAKRRQLELIRMARGEAASVTKPMESKSNGTATGTAGQVYPPSSKVGARHAILKYLSMQGGKPVPQERLHNMLVGAGYPAKTVRSGFLRLEQQEVRHDRADRERAPPTKKGADWIAKYDPAFAHLFPTAQAFKLSPAPSAAN